MRKLLFLMSISLVFCGDAYAVEVPADGVHRTYYEDGSIRTEADYSNGKPHGIFKEYYPSGSLKLEYEYRQGKQHGFAKTYYESGALQRNLKFESGKVEGIAKDYYADGTLKEETDYKNGRKLGLSKEFDVAGALLQQTRYLEDVSSQTVRAPFAKHLPQDWVGSDEEFDEAVLAYYKNREAQPTPEVLLSKEELEQFFTMSYKSGSLWTELIIDEEAYEPVPFPMSGTGTIATTPVQALVKSGVFKEYYENGALKMEVDFESGMGRSYSEDGSLKLEGTLEDIGFNVVLESLAQRGYKIDGKEKVYY